MIELKNISYILDDKVILNNINLKFKNGITVITGPNGAGKSTLAKIIMGLIAPTSGSVIYNGEDKTNKSISQHAELGFSFAFQAPVKFKGIKVIDLLRIACKNNKNVSLGSYLTQVGLCAKEYLMRELDSTLSGGELKRIEIASVLARRTNVNIFDEPEAGIDLWSFSNLTTLFEEYQKNNNNTVIIISHQEKMINLADTLLLMENGTVSYYGEKNSESEKLLNIVPKCNNCEVK